MHPKSDVMCQIFEGLQSAHGVYKISKAPARAGKKVDGKAFTVKEPVDPILWDRHLTGEVGLGVVPINEESMCRFGVIDIDNYSLGIENIAIEIRKRKLPLIVCRSKSGGAHIYVFLSEWMPAKDLVTKLKEIAAYLGYGDCEIFPKQTEIMVERGDMGQWINMPYFNEKRTMTFALKDDGKPATSDEFLKMVNQKRVAPDDFEAIKIIVEEALPGCPPCLKMLITQGFPKGTRNRGLFNLGIYAQRAHSEGWEAKLEEFNSRYMQPELPAEEVLGTIKSLRKKDYSYTCNEAPINAFCNNSECRLCEFGIGGGSGLPVFGSLTKLGTSPPIWFIDIAEGGRLELTTEELQQPLKFQKRCMEELNIMPSVVKREAWQLVVQKLLKDVQVIDVPKEMSPFGQLLEHLETFLTGRAQAKEFKDLLVGKPLLYDGRHYFRMKDFRAYLDRVKFLEFKNNKICSILKDNGAEHHQYNILGKCVQCWSVKEYEAPSGSLSVPAQAKETPY